jgi:TRAP-type C4-dicarboxylate transport system permease large subunit
MGAFMDELAMILLTVPMQQIYRGIMPFLVAIVVLLALLMVAPEIALYLPRTMK